MRIKDLLEVLMYMLRDNLNENLREREKLMWLSTEVSFKQDLKKHLIVNNDELNFEWFSKYK